MPFIRNSDMRRIKYTTRFCKIIHLSTEVKYIGLTLIKGLTWRKQLGRVTNRNCNAVERGGTDNYDANYLCCHSVVA
jgi:hypothetical protein